MFSTIKKTKTRILIIVSIAIILLGSIIVYGKRVFLTAMQPPESSTVSLFAMDTLIEMTANGADTEQALAKAEEKIIQLERMWSVTNPDSEVYKLNHNAGSEFAVSTETTHLIRQALELSEKTSGAIDISIYPVVKAWGFTTGNYQIPSVQELANLMKYVDYRQIDVREEAVQLPKGMEIDLGAVAKGYTGDIIANILKEQNINSAILNLGGNVCAVGSNAENAPWKVGIRDPSDNGNVGVLEVIDQHVITSGGYERYFIGEDNQTYWHIIDPKNGHPARNDLVAVTVISPSGLMGDALSTALFVMGSDGAETYWREQQGFDMILMTDEGRILVTEGIEHSFQLNESYSNIALEVIRK